MKKLTQRIVIMASAVMLSMAGVSGAYAGEIRVDHLGPANTLVRVDADSRYLLLPVEESQDDVPIDVLVDGKMVQSFYCRLAKNKVDYTVPFDLNRYSGHKIIFNVHAPASRVQHGDNVEDEACWKAFAAVDTFDTANREKYRSSFHHTPAYGWMNDPNGMFYKDGVWHIYYQWNPYGSKWSNMTWGHSTSTDLMNWKHHGTAIEPDGLGTIFSGNAVVDHNGSAGYGKDAVVAIYTSAGSCQVQSMAVSTDNGETFAKYAGNPIITLSTEARDPKMFMYEPTGEWKMILAHPLEHEMLIYSSKDLKNWIMESSFGKNLGAQNGVWECPDLFELPVPGSKKTKWVLICNLNPGGPFGGSATQYFVGDFDGKTFTPDRDKKGNVPTKWMDWGKDNYATVSVSNAPQGRRVLIGWMSNWEYAAEAPTQQYRSANTLPRDASLFRGADGDLYLASVPSPEVDALRNEMTVNECNVKLSAQSQSFPLPESNDGICEIDVTLTPASNGTATVKLCNKAGNNVTMTYDANKRTLTFDRTNSGLTGFNASFPAVTTAPVLTSGKSLSLRIFVDRSSIEVFEKDGRLAMTNIVFPTAPYDTLKLSAAKGGKATDLSVYSLKQSK